MVTASRNDPLGRQNRTASVWGVPSLTLKAAQWSGAGGVGLNSFQRIFAPAMKGALGTNNRY
jgi:hypothetical protein